MPQGNESSMQGICGKLFDNTVYIFFTNYLEPGHSDFGPNKHGRVTYIQVNVYVGNTLSWLKIK